MNSSEKKPFAFLDANLPLKALGSDDRVKALGIYTLYAYGGIPSTEAFEKLQRLGLQSTLHAFQASMRDNGVLLKNVKVYALQLVVNPEALPEERMDMDTHTRVRVHLALGYKPLLSFMRRQVREGYQVLSYRQMDDVLSAVLTHPEVKAYGMKFIRRKMNFITRGDPQQEQAIFSDLIESALYNLLRVYPRWANIGNCIAVAKIAVRNRGHNYIKECATKKRGEITRTMSPTGTPIFVASVMNIENALMTREDGSDVLHCRLDGVMGDQEDADNFQSLASLADSPKLKRRQRQYLSLLIGTYDESFSIWLQVESNSILAQEEPFPRYDKMVRTYLGIPQPAAQEFLQSLRSQL